MPECTDCGTYIQSGSRCQQHALENQHGTLEDRRDTCTVCGSTVTASDPITSVDGQTAHAECGGQARCDGGRDLTEWLLDRIEDQVADEASGAQDNSLWTSKARLKAEASKVEFVERDDVPGLVDELEMDGEIVYWHGLVAPVTDDHIGEIIDSEQKADYPRGTLIGRLNQARSRAARGEV